MPRVMLVEDNEVNREMLRKRLERRGFEVFAVESGEQGLEVAKAQRPDAVVMDLGLPGMDGWETTRRLRADPETASLPVIVLTAHVSSDSREKAFAAGCDDFETKPVQLDVLITKLNAAIAKRTGQGAPPNPPSPPVPAPFPSPPSETASASTASTVTVPVLPPREVPPVPNLLTPPSGLGMNRSVPRVVRPIPGPVAPPVVKGSLSDTLLIPPVPPAPVQAAAALPDVPPLSDAADTAGLVLKKHILVVEDNDPNRVMLCRRLQKQGYDTTEARDGREAINLAYAHRFDLILCDIMMPEVDGYQVLETLKADEDMKALPIIMISAVDEMASVVRCIEMGAEDYLQKPYDPVLLNARINACLDKRRMRDLEMAYLRAVADLTQAAAMVESGQFEPAILESVSRRDDALGRLARMFAKMAREVQAKMTHLTQEVQRLKVEIDEARKSEQVAEITESSYFQDLQQKAALLRRRSKREHPNPPAPNS